MMIGQFLTSTFDIPCSIFIILFFSSGVVTDDAPQGTLIPTGASINLVKLWPQIAKAPKTELATIECLIKPDAAAVNRGRSFIVTLSNQSGSDVAGISLTMNQGTVHANVLGTKLQSKTKLSANKWSHVALTINTATVNKIAHLWINGELADDALVLEIWPQSFAVAKMLSDHWGQGRVFTGYLGDVRISNIVRYTKPFQPPFGLTEDENTCLLLPGNRIPFGE